MTKTTRPAERHDNITKERIDEAFASLNKLSVHFEQLGQKREMYMVNKAIHIIWEL